MFEITTIIDTREKQPMKIELDDKPDSHGIIFKDTRIEAVRPIPKMKSIGDYAVEINGIQAPLVIERKGKMDLIQTIMTKHNRERFYKNLEALASNNIETYIIYDYDLYNIHYRYKQIYYYTNKRTYNMKKTATNEVFLNFHRFAIELGLYPICVGNSVLMPDIFRRIVKKHIINNKDKYKK